MTPLLLLLMAFGAQDPVQARARLVNEEVEAGQTTVLRVDVETGGARAQIGRFRSLPPGISLEGTRDFDQRQFSVPGGTRRFVSREFVLRARAPGRYRIPSLDVVVEGRTYTTRSLFLDVTASPRASGGVGDDTSDGVTLRAWLDADTAYVGEQVTFQAEAVFSQDARFRLRRAPEYEPPTPSGFWVHELSESRRPTTRMSEGQMYEVQLFRRAFFPMSPGRYEVPPARLGYEVRRGILYTPETRERETDPLPLVVLPVPVDRPEAFTGAVGSYAVRGWLEPGRVPAGEAAVLTIEVDGVGNVKTLPPPALPDMDAIEVFPPSEEAETEVRNGRIGGTKRFSWVLIPRQAGELEIPEIRYPYFDPELEEFETATIPPFALEVTPGTVTDERSPEPTLRYIEPEPGAADPLGWVRSAGFAAAQTAPLFLLALALAWSRRRRRGERPASPRALRRRRAARVAELDARAGDEGGAVFADAEAFAREWLAERLGITQREAGSLAALRAAGVDESTARAVATLLDELSGARYAPVAPGPAARRDMVRAMDRLLQRVDREAPSRRGAARAGGRGATGLVIALSLAVPLASLTAAGLSTGQDADPADAGQATSPAPADSRAPDRFRDGVRSFDEKEYADAAAAFGDYVRARPRDAAGWYNLGTSHYRAGRRGHAIRAWLAVPRLDPRHQDVRHNLRIADVPPELVDRVAPPFPLRPSELFLLASLAWWTAAIAGAFWLVRRRASAATTAALALVISLVLAGMGWASTRDPETLIVLRTSALRTGPHLRADPVAALEPGTGLAPVDVRGDWVRARTLRGDEGWIEIHETGEI